MTLTMKSLGICICLNEPGVDSTWSLRPVSDVVVIERCFCTPYLLKEERN